MKAVLDEGVPVRLARALSDRDRDVAAFPDAWKGLKNGELLKRITAAGFDCVLTCDKNLRYQQNLRRWKLAVIVLPRTRFEDLHPILDSIAACLDKVETGSALVLRPNGEHVVY